MLINPSGKTKIYRQLSGKLTECKSPIWRPLIARCAWDRGFAVEAQTDRTEEIRGNVEGLVWNKASKIESNTAVLPITKLDIELHANARQFLPKELVPTANFQNNAFHQNVAKSPYPELATQKFGLETGQHIVKATEAQLTEVLDL
mgnify:CR=1 FL=1